MRRVVEVPLGKEAENEIAALLDARGFATVTRIEMHVDDLASITVLATRELDTALGDIIGKHHPGAVALSGGAGEAVVTVWEDRE